MDMNNTVKEDLYKALTDLDEEQFDEFKWRLGRTDCNRKEKIRKDSLEKANRRNVVDLMIQYYEEDALKVCICVLRKSNINDVAKKLEETLQKVADVEAHQLPDSSGSGNQREDVALEVCISALQKSDIMNVGANLKETTPKGYKRHIKIKFQIIKDPNSRLGEYFHLKERYSKLIFIDYHRSEKAREHEIMASGKKHAEIMNMRSSSPATIENLFSPDKHGLIPQVVVLQGAAGIGKTMTARKIMLDWASEQLYHDMFNYIFYIHCREMNLHTDSEEGSILEIISKQWPNSHAMKNTIQEILNKPEKLLFIIDGFDELRFSFDQPEAQLCTDPWKKEPVQILLRSLFQKKLLPESYLLITTRPTALETLDRCLECSRHAEILGFSVEGRVEYFHKFFQNEEQAKLALGLVKQNDTLFTLCVIPLACWIVCTVMKQEMERGKDLQKTPYTLTAVYMLYLSSLLKFHHKESKQDVRINVKGLCSLAAEGIWKQKIFFMEEDVKKHNLDQEDSLPLFLNESIFKRDIDCIQTYSFIHLSFQEFFAALFYVLEEGEAQPSENLSKDLQALLEQALHERCDLTMTVRFLFGFLNEEKRMSQLKENFGWKIPPKNKEFLKAWVKNDDNKLLPEEEMFSYLYQIQDDNFVRNALYDVTAVRYDSKSVMDLRILAYCVQRCQNLMYLCVERKKEVFPPENEEWSMNEKYMEDFFKALTKLRSLRNLMFDRCSFSESCSRHLAELLRKNQSLSVLHLGFDHTDDRAVELLCEELKHLDCKVEELRLHGEYCADSFSRHLAEIVSKNQSLRGLHLSFRNSDDRAVHMLCEGLKHPDCKVEKLRLDEIPLTETCGRHFAEVLSKNQSLRELHLSFCNTDDRALQILLEQLNHPDCKVQELSLDEIPLTETRDRHFAEVLSKNQSLRELHLSFCNTDDRALQILLERLNHPDCKVQELSLEVRSLGEYCTRHLAEIFRTSQRCRMCEFSFWNSDDTAVEVLHEEVKDPDCKVDKLMVDKQFLTDSYGTPFAEIPSKNQRLRQLGFVFYNANERAVEILCEGLKHPDCKVEELRLSTGFCADFFRHFAEVLSKNQRLRDLELSFYDANERAVEMLCEGLKHPDCKVEKLWLDGRFLTESCGRPFAETLSKNQRLKEFKISLYDTEGRVVEMLCEGLKHPDCKVEKLSLDGGILTESCGRLFAETLSKNQRLKELNISLYDTEGRGVEVLCEGLKHPDCKVEKLWLDGQFHGESGSRHFAEVLSKNQRLKELNISLYDIENRAVQILCEGLKHPDCKVEKLWLNGGLYGESGSRHFEEVLSKNQRLKELNISLYDAEGRAVEMLCEGLKHPDCKVEKLWLHGRFLTESCGRPFGETLSKNQRLKELNISLYDTENRAVEMLCEGLKHPDCKVEKLWLDGRILNESYGRLFAEILSKNQRLKEFKISLYDTEGRAVEVLCEGLKHPDCKVEKLWLDGRILNESCGRPFAETLNKNQRLKELNISLYDTENRAVEMLCEGLKHPDCKVEKLWLDGRILNESYGRLFAEILNKNQRLKEFKISLYDTEGRAVEVLCEGLKHPDCKVEKLWLDGRILNESCGRPFAETLSKNQRLKELNISLYDTENRAVEMLCEGLKHPDCKVEKLWLDGRFLTESCGRPFAETVSKNQRLKELKISLYDTEGRAVEMLCEGLKHPDCTVEKLWFDGQFHGESGSRHFAEVLSKNQKLKELKISLYDTEGRAVEMLCEGLKHPDCKVQKLSLNGKDIIRNGEWNDILVWGKDLWSQEEGLQPVMAQAQDADSESQTDLEEAAPAEPVEFQPQERQGQESHEAGETQAPPEQLEKSDEDDIRPPSPRRRRVE